MIKTVKQVSAALRELRRKQSLTGEELGRKAGISQSKISKIETGFYPRLNAMEIEKLLNILDAPSTISQQILHVINDRTSGDVPGGVTFRGTTHIFDSGAEIERRIQVSRLIRLYTAHAIPALLQTAEYRGVSLRHKGLDDSEISTLIRQTIKRQDMLWDGKHKFRIIIPQTALYTFADSKRIQCAQLDRLERAAGLPNIKLGIIPCEAGLTWIEHSSFALYDEHTLAQPIALVELTSKNPADIELHSKVFTHLERLACYDDEATQLIRRAVEYFS